MLDKVIEAFGDMPEFLKDGMRMKYQVRDRYLLARFHEKYDKKLIMVGLVHEPNPDPNSGLEPLYFFEGSKSGCTREQLEISLQDTKAA